jgi:hypothetical protein
MHTPRIKLDDILITERPLCGEAGSVAAPVQQHGLKKIAEAMSHSPQQVIQMLCDLALDATGADATGISWLLPNDEGFKWIGLSGSFASSIGNIVPRFDSPCGTVLGRNTPLLFSRPERYFEWMQPAELSAAESLVIPFYAPSGEACGTFWAATHDEQHSFQRSDAQVLTSLAAHASSALKILGWYDRLH